MAAAQKAFGARDAEGNLIDAQVFLHKYKISIICIKRAVMFSSKRSLSFWSLWCLFLLPPYRKYCEKSVCSRRTALNSLHFSAIARRASPPTRTPQRPASRNASTCRAVSTIVSLRSSSNISSELTGGWGARLDSQTLVEWVYMYSPIPALSSSFRYSSSKRKTTVNYSILISTSYRSHTTTN